MSQASPIYAIGDIHGQLAAFENALSVIEKMLDQRQKSFSSGTLPIAGLKAAG